MFDFDSFKARLANTHFGHTWKTTCQSTCEKRDASENSSYWWGEKRKSPTFWLLLKAKQNLLLSRISGKLLLIIGYYTVYRNCKCSLQTTHHTYRQRVWPKHGHRRATKHVPLAKPPCGWGYCCQYKGDKEVDWLNVQAVLLPLPGRCAQRLTWTSLRQVEGRRGDLYLSTEAKPTLFHGEGRSRFGMQLCSHKC